MTEATAAVPTGTPAPTTAALNVYQMISKVIGILAEKGISKDRVNTDQRYAFRGIDDVYNALAPVLASVGLVVLPRILSRELTERKTVSGKPLFSVSVEAEFDCISSHDGSKHTIRTFGEAMDLADKSTNKAMSAAYKYAAVMAFCIPTEGDNDADESTPDVSAAPQAPARRAPRKAADAPQQQAQAPGPAGPELLNADDLKQVEELCKKAGKSTADICAAYKVSALAFIQRKALPNIVKRLGGTEPTSTAPAAPAASTAN